MPAGLYGKRLKRSNEKLLKQYIGLAKFIVGKYKKSFHLSKEQSDDLEHSLLITIFRATPRYRNPKGVSIIFKTQMRDLIQKTIKYEVEIRMGLLRGGEGLKTSDSADPMVDRLNRSLEIPKILDRLEILTSAERSVIGMSFGVDNFEPFTDNVIARKLGKGRWWVLRKRKVALEKLRCSLGM